MTSEVISPDQINPAISADQETSSVAIYTKHREFLSAATSDNTRRTYRSAIRHFLDWGGLLPASEDMVIRYLVAFAETLNPRTLAVRITAISQWHRQQDFADPTVSATVRKTLLGIENKVGIPKKKAKALPIEDLELIVSHLNSKTSLKAKRDNALLQLGFFGAFRRSELASILVEHIAWEAQGIVIVLPRSKTDRQGRGLEKSIPYGDGILCPPSALRSWLEAANIHSGPVFRPITKGGSLLDPALHPGSVNQILVDCAKLATITYAPTLSGHSLRRGFATSAHRMGAEFGDIKKQGNWRNDGTVQGYIDEANRFTRNAAGTMLKSSKKEKAD